MEASQQVEHLPKHYPRPEPAYLPRYELASNHRLQQPLGLSSSSNTWTASSPVVPTQVDSSRSSRAKPPRAAYFPRHGSEHNSYTERLNRKQLSTNARSFRPRPTSLMSRNTDTA